MKQKPKKLKLKKLVVRELSPDLLAVVIGAATTEAVTEYQSCLEN